MKLRRREGVCGLQSLVEGANGSHTLLSLTVLEELHGLECGTAANELVAQVRLVRLAIVDLVTLLTGFVYRQKGTNVSTIH